MTAPESTARAPWRLLALTFAIALLARAAAALVVSEPPYLDPAYYELVARRLVAGDGFTVPVLWSFLEVGGKLPAEPTLPVASNGHWMPLTSIVSAAFMAVAGTSRLAAQLPSILGGATLVAMTGYVAWDLWRSRRVVVVSVILALFAGPMLLYVSQVDAFAVFGLSGAAAIYASIRAVRDRGGGQWLVFAGLACGLATLTRIDGVMLGAAPLTAWLVRRGIGPWRTDREPIGLRWAIGGVALGLAVVAPWLLRQWLSFGSPLPSAGGQALWITSYNEQFSIGHEVSFGTFLASGPVEIVGSRLTSWGLLIGRTAVLLGGVFLPSFAFGLIDQRRRAELAPFLVFFALEFVVMGALFTFHGPQGAWYHSSWAWLPFAIPLAVGSFEPMLTSLGRRVRLFGRERNKRFLLVGAVAGAVVLSIVGSAAMWAQWRDGRERLETAAAFVRGQDEADVVMYVDPPSLHLETGNPVVAPPFDPPDVVGAVARAYEVRWVVVERERGARGDALGLWEGASWLGDEPALESEDVRIYAVRGS